VDVDESILDNSPYQAWMVLHDTTFSAATWTAYVNTTSSRAIPGALEFTRYADGKGVKVFYITNRTFAEEPATRKNLDTLGFPMGGSVDTMLTTGKRPEWGSAKGTRRTHVARSYRVLLNIGDNLSDFVDDYRGTEAEREKVMDANRDRWGREWIMIANPSYGSFETAPFRHDGKLSAGEKRKAKRNVLDAWPGP
jgi:acid phosphatase